MVADLVYTLIVRHVGHVMCHGGTFPSVLILPELELLDCVDQCLFIVAHHLGKIVRATDCLLQKFCLLQEVVQLLKPV